MTDQRNRAQEHATQLRAALGLDAPLPHLAAVGARPVLFAGGKPRKARPRGAEGMASRAKRGRTQVEEPRIRTLDVGYLETLPDELLVDILEHTLYPADLLHLNQIRAQGGKERRTCMQYEMDLVHGIIKYRDAFRELARNQRLDPLLRDPNMRRRFYRRWLMTPIEGLYEDVVEDGLSHAWNPQQVDNLKIRDFYSNQPLPLSWYGDAFLATVVANEWKHALTMSTARAFGLTAWWFRAQTGHVSGAGPGRIVSRFIEYWNFPRPGTALMARFLRKSFTEVFTRDRLPLTFDDDQALMFGDTEGLGIVPYRHFQGWSQDQLKSAAAMLPDAQTRQQYNLGARELRTAITATISTRAPRTAQLLLYFAQSSIEVMRISSFRNRPDRIPLWEVTSYLFAMTEYFPKLWFTAQDPDIPEQRPVLFFNWPIEMNTGQGAEHLPAGFTPWHTQTWRLRLGGIRVEEGSRLKEVLPILTSDPSQIPDYGGDIGLATNEIALRRPFSQGTVNALNDAIRANNVERIVEITTDTMTH